MKGFLFSVVIKKKNMRGTPAQIGFIDGGPGYILGCKKGIYTENE